MRTQSVFVAFGAVLGLALAPQAFAAGVTVHGGKSCQSLYDSCLANIASRAKKGLPALMTPAECQKTLEKTLDAPVVDPKTGDKIYIWQNPQGLPEKCSN